MPLLIFFLLIKTISFAQIFNNAQYMITSFPNLDRDGSYTVHSYSKTLKFSEQVEIAPFSRVQIYGKSYGNLIIVDKYIILSHSPFENIAKFRYTLTQQAFKHGALPGFVLSLTLGNKNFLSPEFQEAIRASGLSHAFVLSGLHMAIVLVMMIWVFNLFHIPSRFHSVLLFLPALGYLFIGGMGISLQRSFLFYLIWAVFRLFRIPLPIHKIFITAFVVSAIISPMSLFSISFILSYGAVAGLVFFAHRVQRVFTQYLGNFFGSLVATSICAGLAVLPILILMFREINMASFLATMLVTPMMPFIIVLCFISLVTNYVNQNFSMIDRLLEISYDLVYAIAVFFSRQSSLYIIFTDNMNIMIFLLIIMIFACILIYKKGKI